MSATLPLPPSEGGPRFPGFDVMTRSREWDDATRATVHSRLHSLPAIRFFTREEEATAKCLLDRLVGQHDANGDVTVDLVRMVDARLAEDQTDGWHYDTMPTDEDAWRQSLAALDDDARAAHDEAFADLDRDRQRAVIEAVRTCTDERWHDLPPRAVWSLWTRYAATAFYSHPAVWNEIGFSGPAYPRGYKNLGVGRLEPSEVHDVNPGDDPLRRQP
ncbi:gluconate 2-dehydrogenase subunit 3 family protein [Herbiconiux sp. VKM Ac-2851]|uniref:gluconate 2-dehydrogenase subunit 3 family protein n=1 Tax=Herbiconiux sp. VKM Ac-2851 TaxID=2739025 RepID=UPI001565337A|nr:gluconate 2-dehydrogenase subunit 3 family protein [Herbiconiux sp. VKM Ac-2851]NQX37178.1 gluconate 2-dehydrogenase subunit 3 family protein [Herbiconiux sp. VKM Ac-2851]